MLNAMQIRKALAYGGFISSLYENANKSEPLRVIFGKQHINKDRHVEFLLGVYVTYKILQGKFQSDSRYQKYILNDFCEENKDDIIESDFIELFNKNLELLEQNFDTRSIFKKVDDQGNFHGNRNNNIAEVLLATSILEKSQINSSVVEKYKKYISENIEKFAVNKVTGDLLRERHTICRSILEV
ncbi:hypothetical protein [Streptococcus sp. X16XC17]|uniref:hypothetical protein n=1 Tax=Streptococcus sp. X16XC17 TaxID=2316646 RepID=UPI0019D1A0C5|nr:hypothetical protein [Streptococcus sp. X16XC17]